MGVYFSLYARLIVYLYLYQKVLGQSASFNLIKAPHPHTPVASGKQIEEEFECNQSDSENCCAEDEFKCDDGSCIPLINLCDSKAYGNNQTNSYKTDCDDGSDETGCSELMCSSRSTPCQHSCSDLPNNRSRCFCDEGYTPRQYPHDSTCQDIDECKLGSHTCSQICINLEGSYNCSCSKGFHLDDKKGHYGKCKAEDIHILILFNAHHWINSYDMESKVTRELVFAGKVSSMDYDPVTDVIYWWNEHLKTLSRSFLPGDDENDVTVGHEQKVCVTNDGNSIRRKSIAIDWSLGNLYWILNHKFDYGSKASIMMTKLEGTPTKMLYYKINATITSLAVDPPRAKIYWTTAGRHASEIGFSENGVEGKTFVTLKGQHPSALAIDQSNGRLYWFDSKSITIYQAHKKGSKPIKILKLYEDQIPMSIDVSGNHLYWVTKSPDDLSRKAQLIRYDKYGKGEVEIILDNLVGQSSLKVYHKSKSKDSKIRWGNMRKKCHESCGELCIRETSGFACIFADILETTDVSNKCLKSNLNRNGSFVHHPLRCNCKELHKICDYSSPHHECNCNLPCQNFMMLKGVGTDTNTEQNVNITGAITVSILISCVLATCFVLSFYKQRRTVKQTKSIQMQEVK